MHQPPNRGQGVGHDNTLDKIVAVDLRALLRGTPKVRIIRVELYCSLWRCVAYVDPNEVPDVDWISQNSCRSG